MSTYSKYSILSQVFGILYVNRVNNESKNNKDKFLFYFTYILLLEITKKWEFVVLHIVRITMIMDALHSNLLYSMTLIKMFNMSLILSKLQIFSQILMKKCIVEHKTTLNGYSRIQMSKDVLSMGRNMKPVFPLLSHKVKNLAQQYPQISQHPTELQNGKYND